MKSMYVMLCAVLTGAIGGFAQADGDRPVLVRAPIRSAYIPTGFDSNDRAQIVIEGSFSNTCYRTGPQEVAVDEAAQKITVTEGAYYYQGPCLMMLVGFNQTVHLGILKAGEYSIVDGASKKVLGILPIAKASNQGPDDFMYAVVHDAYVTYENGQRDIVLKLQMPGKCWVLDENRVIQEGSSVMTVLPIVKWSDTACDEAPVSHSMTVKLPKLSAGKYLLHVRSLEGQSVMKLFEELPH